MKLLIVTGRFAMVLVRSRLQNWLLNAVKRSGAVSPAARAVRRRMRLKLIVHLVRRSTMENEYERLPLEALTQDILGLAVRKVVIPVAAGRNMAVLTEAAVRSTVLSLRGIDTTREFVERQHQMIEQGGQA